MAECAALVVAAGRGQRFGGSGPKQYHHLGGEPILRRTLRAFCLHPRIDAVVPVIHADDAEIFREAAIGLPEAHKIRPPVSGGATRQQSVINGLESMAADPPRLVLIHDGARPMVTAGVIDAVFAGLAQADGAIPVLPVIDTLKRVGPDSRIESTIARATLARAQTPQGFRFASILAAHRAAVGIELTDDAAALEHAGGSVIAVAGAEVNVKVTTPADLAQLDRLLSVMRVGQGFDVHRFGNGDGVWLCGLKVPHDRGLEGHSDADVALHAATDAILGAIGAGDIGHHFPPTDPTYRNASSDRFIRHAHDLLKARGGLLEHLDITIICERPKVGPHRAAMTARIGEILGVPSSRISVKATTTEGLGFTGRREGIAAQAIATVRVPDVSG